jgi:hypothetical protein
MSTKLIELPNGVLVEVEALVGEGKNTPGASPEKVNSSGTDIAKTVLGICVPIANAFDELKKRHKAERVEVELCLGFKAEGSIFVTKGSAEGNIKIKCVML